MSALDTAQLPQYLHSSDFMERFLDAAHYKGQDIVRYKRPDGFNINVAVNAEMVADALFYFTENKEQLENEFKSDLIELIGERKASRFFKIISTYWFDGRAKRFSPAVQGLKSSVAAYLQESFNVDPTALVVDKDVRLPRPFFFGSNDIRKILNLNHQMLYKHLQEWMDQHPNSSWLSRGEIYFRRGIGLQKAWPDGSAYIEWDFINSYTLSISASEQFAMSGRKPGPTIVASDCDYFNNRVLFFSPFIPGMPASQLEFGIIPSSTPTRLEYHGNHAGIHEYFLR